MPIGLWGGEMILILKVGSGPSGRREEMTGVGAGEGSTKGAVLSPKFYFLGVKSCSILYTLEFKFF